MFPGLLCLFATVCYGICLKLQTVFSANMGELGLYRFSDGISSIEAFFYYFFHDGDIPYITKKTIHLDYIFESKVKKSKTFFHFIKRAVYLFLNCSAHIAYAVVQEAVLPCFDYA